MSAIFVDPAGLAEVATAIRSVARQLEPSPVEVRLLADRVSGQVGGELAVLARRMDDIVDRLAALGKVVALVGQSFAATEDRVAGSLSSPMPVVTNTDLARISDLLAAMEPAALEALLTESPALAQLVVERPLVAEPGSPAALLLAVLRSGEPATVVLLQAQALLLGLSEPARRRLALLRPALVSGLASAPVGDRIAATRVLVSAAISRTSDEGRRRQYAELLAGTVTLTRPDGTRLVRPHQLLSFDPRGDGRVVEVFGDLATARHLAVYVPGTGTSLDRYAGNAERASSFAAAEPDLAVVLWQNADFPDQPLDDVVPPPALWDNPVRAVEHQLRAHVVAAAYRDAADRAGPILARDVEGLRMTAPGPAADLTVLGHSYGGSIVGSAEAHGLVADRVVHIASAGAYVSDVHAYTAGECGTRRFSMTTPDDPVQLAQGAGFGSVDQVGHSLQTVSEVLPGPLKALTAPLIGVAVATSSNPLQAGHGLDPDLIPAVTRLDTGVRPDGVTLVSGHGGMFEPGSSAWRNLVAVMHGDPVQVLEPERWHSELVPTGLGPQGVSLPHYVVTRSPYDAPGYLPPRQPSVGRVCAGYGSW